MKDRCITIAELDSVLQPDAAAARRRHVEECPRCRALVSAYQEFLRDHSVPPGADVGDAATRLRAQFVAALQEAPVSQDAAPGRPLRTFSLPWLVAPRLRPVWILATVVVVLVGVYGGHEILRDRGRPSRLRSAPELAGEEPPSRLTLIASHLRRDGSLELRWRPVASADSYEVLVFGPDLVAAGRFGAGADTALVLSAEQLHTSLPSRGLAGLQVVGRRAGREIAISAVVTVDISVHSD